MQREENDTEPRDSVQKGHYQEQKSIILGMSF